MRRITFTNLDESLVGFTPPRPASEYIPEWYKSMPGYFGDKANALGEKQVGLNPNGTVSAPQTMKRCMPLLDAITAGYILTTPCDIQITQQNGAPFYIWPSDFQVITWHSYNQVRGNPTVKENVDPPKFMNPWGIKTPPGYSSLFVPPLNNGNGIFEVFSAIVDTDQYAERIHFPFRLLVWEWEGVIPAGTPIVQVIPFARDSFQSNIGGEKEVSDARRTETKIKSLFYNAYRKYFWTRKEYR